LYSLHLHKVLNYLYPSNLLCWYLAQFLALFIQSDQPEVVVIGGNIANAHELFFPPVAENLAAQSIHVPLRRAQLGEAAALIGAASGWE
jgi:glucokinase